MPRKEVSNQDLEILKEVYNSVIEGYLKINTIIRAKRALPIGKLKNVAEELCTIQATIHHRLYLMEKEIQRNAAKKKQK